MQSKLEIFSNILFLHEMDVSCLPYENIQKFSRNNKIFVGSLTLRINLKYFPEY